MNGERVEDRLALIRNSNWLTDEHKWLHQNCVKNYCLLAFLNRLCGTTIDLGDGLSIRLNRPSSLIKDGELPGTRMDHMGDLVIEGEYFKDGKKSRRFDDKGYPLWPLIIRDPPVTGAGPWENFQAMAFKVLRDGARQWLYEGAA